MPHTHTHTHIANNSVEYRRARRWGSQTGTLARESGTVGIHLGTLHCGASATPQSCQCRDQAWLGRGFRLVRLNAAHGTGARMSQMILAVPFTSGLVAVGKLHMPKLQVQVT